MTPGFGMRLESGPTIVGQDFERLKLDVRPKVRGGNGKRRARTRGKPVRQASDEVTRQPQHSLAANKMVAPVGGLYIGTVFERSPNYLS